jgi:hypothetical protein
MPLLKYVATEEVPFPVMDCVELKAPETRVRVALFVFVIAVTWRRRFAAVTPPSVPDEDPEIVEN